MANNRVFTGWVALITGGAGGLGRAIAAALIGRGIKCLLVDIDAERLAQVSRALGPMAPTYKADLTDAQALEELVNQVRDDFVRLDLLVNNAGILSNTSFEVRSMQSIAHEVQLNMLLPIALTQALLGLLQQAVDGR